MTDCCDSDCETRTSKHCEPCGETTVFDTEVDLEPHSCPACGEEFETP